MADGKTIKIKKTDLWKYSTFLLILFVIIGSVFIFTKDNGNTNNNGGTTGADLSVFEDNPDLFPFIGPEDSENVVVEFSDFQCPYCTMVSGIPSWIDQYATGQYGSLIGVSEEVRNVAEMGELKFIYVPMSFLDDGSATKESDWAVEAGYCAHEQEKFWEMHDKIFGASTGPSENDGKYSKENLKGLASGISGLNTEEFNDCLDNGKYESAVQQAASYASTAASGTPTFYVNGEKVSPVWSSIQEKLV